MNSLDVFWVVWNPGAGLPRVKHNTEQKAKNEAERLALLNPGQRFYVLEANTVSEVARPVVTRPLEYSFESLDETPF